MEKARSNRDPVVMLTGVAASSDPVGRSRW